MGKVNVQKRGKVYQYQFEIAPVDGKRKFKNKSGFKTRAEAEKEGIKAYTEYMNTGHACIKSIRLYFRGFNKNSKGFKRFRKRRSNRKYNQ